MEYLHVGELWGVLVDGIFIYMLLWARFSTGQYYYRLEICECLGFGVTVILQIHSPRHNLALGLAYLPTSGWLTWWVPGVSDRSGKWVQS